MPRVEFADVVRRRRMTRNYDPDRPVPAEIRERMLAHAVRAPSAGFSQGWAFLVLEAAEDRARFWAAAAPAEAAAADSWLEGMQRAPLLVVPMSCKRIYLDRYAEPDKPWPDRDERHWPVPFWHMDAAMAALLMTLTAVDAGLGSCFFGIPVERYPAVHEAFGIPGDHTPVGVVSVGYVVTDRPSPSLRRGRRPMSEVVHYGRWGN